MRTELDRHARKSLDERLGDTYKHPAARSLRHWSIVSNGGGGVATASWEKSSVLNQPEASRLLVAASHLGIPHKDIVHDEATVTVHGLTQLDETFISGFMGIAFSKD